MCACGNDHGFSRRRFLAGMTAVAAGVAAQTALASPLGACLPALPGNPAERLSRRAGKSDAVSEPSPAARATPITGALAGAIRGVELPAGERTIALTFDLCETRGVVAGYDGAIVDYLRSAAVPATFFAGGLWLGTHRERALELLSDPLFAVGNHSWTHHDLHSATALSVEREILVTEAALAEARSAARARCPGSAAEPAHRLFRFPYGSCSPGPLATANAVGSVVIQWDVVSGDPDGTSAKTIEHAVLSGARPGAIVVMHANGRGTHTAEALKTIVPALRNKGFSFTTVDKLLGAGKPVAATTCYIDRIGDTARYDHPTPPAGKLVTRPPANVGRQSS